MNREDARGAGGGFRDGSTVTKTAVVLFNLGGPDRPESVRPFLFNLFNDPAIIGLPTPLRWCLAKLISKRRAPIAQEIYENLGGGSPLLPNTEKQAAGLEARLQSDGAGLGEIKVFIAMRYWHPMSEETAAAVRAFQPNQVLLLPLYPQFSTTTTGSSVTAWKRAARRAGVTAESRVLCCYPTEAGFIEAVARLTAEGYRRAQAAGKPRILFSAHGLPKRIVERGDPYQWQVEQSAAAVVRALGEKGIDGDGLDWLVCYQSRVGPLEWIGPATEDEIGRAGKDGVPVVLVPIAFVSEHSETLVELDIEYRELASEAGVSEYVRVPTVSDDPRFLDGLARQAALAIRRGAGVAPAEGETRCPENHGGCPCRASGGRG